jgi:lipoprotein signal peptidase
LATARTNTLEVFNLADNAVVVGVPHAGETLAIDA